MTNILKPVERYCHKKNSCNIQYETLNVYYLDVITNVDFFSTDVLSQGQQKDNTSEI